MDSSVAVAPIGIENGVEETENKISHHKKSSKGGWNAAIFIISMHKLTALIICIYYI